MLSFYEFQLVVLVSLCFTFLLFERYALRKQSKHQAGAADTTFGSSISSKLMRQYLVVYAIVMGKHVWCMFQTYSNPPG